MKLTETKRRAERNALAALAVLFLLSPAARAQEKASSTPTPAPTPAAQATDAKRAGQDVPVPTRKKYVAPAYPLEAAAQGIRGIVILEVLIGEDGSVQSAKPTRSIPGLDEAALTAVKLWEYEPTKLAGKPVKVLLSQSITFTLRLPDLERAPGVPELKSGGSPSVPSTLTTPETATVGVTLGTQGEVSEASVVDGNPLLGDALLRAVKFWRFVVSEGSTPPSFKVRAEWTPTPRPSLTLKALDLKAVTAASSGMPPAAAPIAAPAPSPASTPTAPPPATPAPAAPKASPMATSKADAPPAIPSPSASPSPMGAPGPPAVQTDVLTARMDPPAPTKEQGISAVADVTLGENIPDLVKGRRPIWPPLARLGNVGGEVVVRFSVDLAGKVTVHSTEGTEMLKAAAEQAVATWVFRRTAIDRLHLVATFKFGGERTTAKVERVP